MFTTHSYKSLNLTISANNTLIPPFRFKLAPLDCTTLKVIVAFLFNILITLLMFLGTVLLGAVASRVLQIVYNTPSVTLNISSLLPTALAAHEFTKLHKYKPLFLNVTIP